MKVFDYPVKMTVKPDVKAFFDPATNTISYVVKDPNSKACAVVDSVSSSSAIEMKRFGSP